MKPIGEEGEGDHVPSEERATEIERERIDSRMLRTLAVACACRTSARMRASKALDGTDVSAGRLRQ